jgi:hypothetical protein
MCTINCCHTRVDLLINIRSPTSERIWRDSVRARAD